MFFVAEFSRAAAPIPPPAPTAMLLILGDQHSAYERAAQIVARMDRWHTENPQIPFAILLDGDVFEAGNMVAHRSLGAIDYAMFAALAKRAPTILNVGNHEPEFYDLGSTLGRVRATGVQVVSNIVEHSTGKLFTPASLTLPLGKYSATVVGISTDRLATFRLAVRPSLDLSDPVVWAKAQLPGLLTNAPIKIVLSHAGLTADRQILPLLPNGTLFAGAHDHLRLVEKFDRTVYVHSGSWNEYLTFASLTVEANGAIHWEVRQEKIQSTDAGDPALARLIRDTQARHLTGEDTLELGRLARAMSPEEAAKFVVHALKLAAGTDAACVSHTTFGGGLPAGRVTRADLVSCVRFDGPIFIGEVSGTQLRALLAAANETPDTPFAQRKGDYLVAEGPEKILPQKKYRIATTDWVARNPKPYLGEGDFHFVAHAKMRLQEIAVGGLGPAEKSGRPSIIIQHHD